MNENKREAVNLAIRRGKDSAAVKLSKNRGRLLTAQTTNGGTALATAFTTDAIVILEVFEKKAQKTPRKVIDSCKRRFRLYDT